MRCEAFEAIVTDLSRPEALDQETRAGALAHAARCPRCSRTLAAAKALSAELEELAAQTAAAEPPRRLEHALRAAARQRKSAPRITWSRIGAAAAVLAVMALLAAGYLRHARPAGPAPATSATATDATRAGDYIPLGYGEASESDVVLVVRVKLPAAMLTGLGWAGDAGTGGGTELLQADVVLGQDGVARAIRFVE